MMESKKPPAPVGIFTAAANRLSCQNIRSMNEKRIFPQSRPYPIKNDSSGWQF